MKKFTLSISALFALVFAWQFALAGNPYGLTWGEVGPNNIGNHTRALFVDASSNVWAGSVGGGLWQSTNGGTTWAPAMDGNSNLAVAENLAVSSIAADGNNIYVGTGELAFVSPDDGVLGNSLFTSWTPGYIENVKEGFHGYSGMPGEGVFVSTDGGATWNHNNATWGGGPVAYDNAWRSVQKVAAQGGKVLMATLEGLYWSTDGLSTVTKSSGPASLTDVPVHDVEFGANNTVYAATADSLYISTDGGASFGTAVNIDYRPNGSTVPSPALRTEVAVAPSDANIAYVTFVNRINGSCTGVWKTDNNGSSWARVAPQESSVFNPFQNEGLYNCILEVDPTDANSFIIAGAAWFTFDPVNGLTQSVSHFWFPGFIDDYVPTPILSVAFDPNNPETHYVGTDAEIVKSTDNGETYVFKTSGFGGGHLYSACSAPNWKTIASDKYAGVIYKSSANTSPGLQQFNIIDEGIGKVRFSMVDYDHVIGPANAPDWGVARSINNGESWESFYEVPLPVSPAYLDTTLDDLYINRANSSAAGGGVYNIPIAQVRPWCLDAVIPPSALQNDSLIKQTPEYLFMTSREYVWICSNPFGLSTDSIPNWNRITNGLIDIGGASSSRPNEVFTAIQVSGDNSHTVYTGSNYGKMYRITNANDIANLDTTDIGWVDMAGTLPARWITSIAFDPNDANNMVVTFGAYETGDARVMISNNALAATPDQVTFRDITGNLPDIPVYSAVFHPDPAFQGIIIGTEKGVYTSTDDYTSAGSHTWNQEITGLNAEVPVYDLYFRRYFKVDIGDGHYKYHPDNTLIIATHGRGVWVSNSVVGIEEEVANVEPYDVKLFPNPAVERSTVEFNLERASTIKVEVVTLEGRTVISLPENQVSAGVTRLGLNFNNLNSGVYLIKTTITNDQGTFSRTLKSVVTK